MRSHCTWSPQPALRQFQAPWTWARDPTPTPSVATFLPILRFAAARWAGPSQWEAGFVEQLQFPSQWGDFSGLWACGEPEALMAAPGRPPPLG